MRKINHIVSSIIVVAVRIYRVLVSPVLPACCRYHPTCSSYMIMAVKSNGPLFGTLQGVARIVRCNPFSPGGVDFPGKLRSRVSDG